MEDRDFEWRRTELKRLSGYIQRKIKEMQNPDKEKCSKSKKLVCQLNKGCGFGCQLHHVVYCFVVAIATNRVLILNDENWQYAIYKPRGSAWISVFQPVSETCRDDEGSTRGFWGSDNQDTVQVI